MQSLKIISFLLFLLGNNKTLLSKVIPNSKIVSENHFLHHLFQNEDSENYVNILNEFHIKLIKLANSDCLIRTQGTIDDAYINKTQINSNNNLWQQYFQHNYKNKAEETSLIDKLTETVRIQLCKLYQTINIFISSVLTRLNWQIFLRYTIQTNLKTLKIF